MGQEKGEKARPGGPQFSLRLKAVLVGAVKLLKGPNGEREAGIS